MTDVKLECTTLLKAGKSRAYIGHKNTTHLLSNEFNPVQDTLIRIENHQITQNMLNEQAPLQILPHHASNREPISHSASNARGIRYDFASTTWIAHCQVEC